jgi:hypothetical protein
LLLAEMFTRLIHLPGVARASPCDVNGSLFPAESGVRVISEPGRYFVEGGFHMYARIFAKREIYSRDLVSKLLRSKKNGAAAPAPEPPINFDDDGAESGEPRQYSLDDLLLR